MEQKFKVIYLGKLNEDQNQDNNVILIAQRFADKFKMSQDKATKILNAGKEVVLHPGAEHVKAYKLKAALEGLGLQMRLERVQITKTAKVETTTPETTSPAENAKQKEGKPIEAEKIAAVSEEKTSTSPVQKFNTDSMSLEPMAEESGDSEEENSKPESTTESTETKTKDDSQSPQKAADVNSPSWDLEPIQEEKVENAAEGEEETEGKKVVAKQEYVDLSKPSMIYEKKSGETEESENEEEEKLNDGKEDKEPSAIISFAKQFGGVIAAGLIGILFLAKKFGLLKFLKIGGLMAAAAYAGYNPEEACMGNDDCEDAVSDQIDACWSYSELDKHDWDNMSDDQYYELKPEIEEKFISCFRYEATGERVLESPIELRFDLIDMCDMLESPVSDCQAIAEKQIKMCYDRSEIIDPIKEADYDYYGAMLTDMQYFKNFYGCFEDNNGSMLFAEFVNEMDVDAMNDALEQLQNELNAQQ